MTARRAAATLPARAWRLPLAAAIGLVVLLVLAVMATLNTQRERAAAEVWRQHTYKVIIETQKLSIALIDAQRGQRGFLLTGDASYLTPFALGVAQLPRAVQRLRTDTTDNSRQQRAVMRLDAAIRTHLAELERTVTLAQTGDRIGALALMRTGLGERTIEVARVHLDGIVEEEQRLLTLRTRAVAEAEADSRRATGMLVVIGSLLFILALTAAWGAQRGAARARAAEAFALNEAENRALLEKTVAERTAEIVASNAALKAEIAGKERAEAQVRQMQKLESVGQLTGGIAHDFNNMLAIVIGSLDLALRRLDDPTGRVLKYIDNAMDGAKRAATLTARLLAFARQQALAPEPIDANVFVGNISELLRRTLGEGIQIESVLAGGLWRTYADAGELENAVLNLSVNARDAMNGEGRLTIETANTHLDDAYAAAHAEVTPGQYIAICVTDTGGGMPPEVIEKAFDPFFTTKGVGKGTGLGLSQVYGFVRQSGGHVKIYSEPGEGTTIKLYLPRWTGADSGERVAVEAAGELPTAREGEAVLVVEDEESVRLVTVDALRDLGYAVTHAADGRAALTALAADPSIDLLLTDIVMPGMNGRELADTATADRPELKVLYTTGYTRNAVVHNGMLDAQVAFLPKPFSVHALAMKVRQVLDGGGVNRKV